MEGGEEGWSGGDDNTNRKYPIGFRFTPTDEELVEFYLLPKVQGKPTVPNDAVIEADVYECDPEILIEQRYKDRGETKWHFLSPRSRKYQKGVRPSRRTADDRGRWKPSTGKSQKNKEQQPEDDATEEQLCSTGRVTYCVNTLAYHTGPANSNEEEKTKWLMHEITLPDYEIKMGDGMVLDKYALCIIYMSPLSKWRKKDEDGETSTARDAGASSSKSGPAPESGQGTSAPPLSEKLAGKRPAVEQPQVGRARATKRARQPAKPRGPPAPAHGNGGGVPLGVGAATYYSVPGHQVQMPWPPVTQNRLQGPVQLSQPRMVQHNGRQVAAPPHYGQGQAPPVQGLAGSSLRQPVSAHNNSMGRNNMVMGPPPPRNSFDQKMMMMMRPQNNGLMMNMATGQAVLPPPSDPQPPRERPVLDMNDPDSHQVISMLLTALQSPESRHLIPPSIDAAQICHYMMASNLPPAQQQQHPPTLEAGGQQNQQQQQSSSAVPATSVSLSGSAVAPAEATPPASDGGKEALDSSSDNGVFADFTSSWMRS